MVVEVIKLVEVDYEFLQFIWEPLKQAGYDSSEQELLRAIKENKTKLLVYYAVLGLRKVGTEKSVDILKRLISYPFEDVKTTSVLAIAAIAGGKETDFLTSLIDSKEYHVKSYPLAALWEVGDSRAIGSMLGVAHIAKSGNLPKGWDWDDIPYLQSYILKWSKPSEVLKLDKELDHLFMKNKWSLVQRLSYKIKGK